MSNQDIQTVPLGDLRQGIEALLQKKDGSDYVQKLLDEANRLFALNYPHIKTFWDGFEKITNAGGYQLVGPNITDPTLQNINGGTVRGDLFANGAKPGTVYLAPFKSFGTPSATTFASAQAGYAYRALHETFHLGRQGGYTDEQMAKAGYSLAGLQAPTYGASEILKWSGRFDDFLVQHCPRI
jgi:hypothetical protein